MNEAKWIYKHEPRYEMKDLIGIDQIIKKIKSKIINPIKFPIKKVGTYNQTIGNILCVGPSGTLKSELSEAISEEINATYYEINLNRMFWEDEDKYIEELFTDILRFEHAILYCKLPEEGDVFFKVIEAQRELIKVNGIDSIILIASSEEPWNINSKYLENDNFKYLINYTLPNFETRKKLLFFGEFDETNYEKDFPFDMLAKITKNYNYDNFDDMCSKIMVSDKFVKRAMKKRDTTFRSKQFIKFIKKNKPEISEIEIMKFQEWHNEIVKSNKFSGEII